MYATFAEDLTGFFGKWTLHAHAPRSKRLGSPVASKHSGRVNAATVSPIREPKWTDQTDEEDEDLFSEYFVDGGVTPTPNVEPSAGTAPPGGRTGREVNLRVPGARAARREKEEVKNADKRRIRRDECAFCGFRGGGGACRRMQVVHSRIESHGAP